MSNHSGTKTILCIDDDDSVLGTQKALLERRGYAVLTAPPLGKVYKSPQSAALRP